MSANNTQKLSKDTHYELVKELAKTETLSSIAKQLGCSVSTICKFAKENSIPKMYGSVRKSLEAKLPELMELAKTKTSTELSKMYNVSSGELLKVFKLNGIPSFESYQRSLIEKHLRESASEMSLEVFSKTFNFSRSTVKGIANKLGIEFNKDHRLISRHEEIIKELSTKIVTQAAKNLNLPDASLYQYAKRHNIETVKPKAKEKLPGHIVYAYYDVDGIVRYYGEGSSEARAFHFAGHKAKGYTRYFAATPPTVKILHYGLSKEEALLIEQELVTENLNTIKTVYNHRITSRHKKLVDFDSINELVYYDETSPTCLKWKVTDNYGTKVQGEQAGYFQKSSGYSSIHFSKLGTIKCHVIVWLLHNKTHDPKKCVDHINGNRGDNRISNLREVSHSENCKNKPAKSSTGFKNLYWNQNNQCYTVKWTEGTNRPTVYFLVSKYGDKDSAFLAAKEFWDEKVKEGLIYVRTT